LFTHLNKSSASSRISKGHGYQGFLRKRAGSSFGQKRAICVVQGKTWKIDRISLRVRTPQERFFSRIFQVVFTHNFQYISGLFYTGIEVIRKLDDLLKHNTCFDSSPCGHGWASRPGFLHSFSKISILSKERKLQKYNFISSFYKIQGHSRGLQNIV
jgi:hypothetical protein